MSGKAPLLSPFMQQDDTCWMKEVDDAACAAADCGFEFVQAHAPGYNPLKESDYECSMHAMCRSVDACGRLRIPTVVLHTSCGYRHLRLPFQRKRLKSVRYCADF